MIAKTGLDGLTYHVGINPDKHGEIWIWQPQSYGCDLQSVPILILNVLELFSLEGDDTPTLQANPDSPACQKVSWLDASPD